jgi:hypothetical protein
MSPLLSYSVEMAPANGRHYDVATLTAPVGSQAPICFGGEDRSKASMAAFCDWLGPTPFARVVD